MGSIVARYIMPYSLMLIPFIREEVLRNRKAKDARKQKIKKTAAVIDPIKANAPAGDVLMGDASDNPHAIARVDEQAIFSALVALTEDMEQKKPDVIILLDPLRAGCKEGFSLGSKEAFKGSFNKYTKTKCSLSYSRCALLTQALEEELRQRNLYAERVSSKLEAYLSYEPLDIGAMTPMYYLQHGFEKNQLVLISPSLMPDVQYYELGKAIQSAVEKTELKAAVVAVMELSDKLGEGSRQPYSSIGGAFNAELLEKVCKGDVLGLLEMDHKMRNSSGSRGLSGIYALLGSADGREVKVPLCTSGIYDRTGMMVASLETGETVPSALAEYKQSPAYAAINRQSSKHSLIDVARRAIKYKRSTGKRLSIPKRMPAVYTSTRHPCIVSLYKDGLLRGRAGDLEAKRHSTAEEVILNACAAAETDPRFIPLRDDELDAVVIHIDILSKIYEIKPEECTDPKKYGLYVTNGRYGKLKKTAWVMPGSLGIETGDNQREYALALAHIGSLEKYQCYRFEIEPIE